MTKGQLENRIAELVRDFEKENNRVVLSISIQDFTREEFIGAYGKVMKSIDVQSTNRPGEGWAGE